MKLPYYSWVLPIKNEEESLPKLLSEIKSAMKGKSFEIIAVNDFSDDACATVLKTQARKIPALKVINLPSHQGKWAALLTGFRKAKGSIVITSDSDLQDNPKEIIKLLAKLAKDNDVVSGWRKTRYDPLYKVLISKIGNDFISFITSKRFYDVNSPFKVYRREVFDAIPHQGSLLRFSLLFAYRLGFKTAEVPITHRERPFGKSKFGLLKYLRIIYDLTLILLLFSGSGRLRTLGKTIP